ncbi:pyruvate:ferredoxin (flavodoxin) oxidoreductase [candidate division KSB3 bacterium]|uniref:Pyruvate:ferredoxin (Flavodoxin) oxidoreductase n=1 Tax=candidate division KSB3 bacterium TaxID=2044937 RepID=A0A2G6E3V1_9BACT|nr:MAG: pyruvate:ferredoxin (flavodoxin) oxidoreductase [candidate division KSB3 bacterium]PIE28925.1 MAG: pyruvate:ferredoxin (flavodoxin) oxidoreductase [candidate division KSB3 bacterium]
MSTPDVRTIDGNTAAAYVSYAFSDVAALYPITPSSPMGETADEMRAKGMKNIFGQTVRICEMQSEAGAAGAVHGSLVGGALTTTFTASQGLLLMIPNMYKISGELLPGVFQVSARSIAGHALSIFGDHSDVMATRQIGWGMLASANNQEIVDLSIVSHLTAIQSRVPILHFFDGFRSSHEISKVELPAYEELAKIVDWQAIKAFKARGFRPEKPEMRGTAQNPDVFFQAKEACNSYYDKLPAIIEENMKKVTALTGRQYNLFDYFGDPDATNVIVCMTTGADVIEETIDALNAQGEKLGLIKVRVYRPWSSEHFLKALPANVTKITVLDRTKEAGSLGEPLYEDVLASLYESGKKDFTVLGGRYGLSSKEFTPAMVKAVYNNMDGAAKNHFTVGITDDVTKLSLEVKENINTEPEGTIRCKFWGLGSDGTVGANKNSIKIIGDHTDMYAQGYFSYDSKKSGGITVSHLRFGPKEIKSHYLLTEADFIACHTQSYVTRLDVLEGIREGGNFLLNCVWSPEELEEKLPASVKHTIARKKVNFYIINAYNIAEEIGLGHRINMVLQSAFFKISGVLPFDKAMDYMKDAVKKTYGKKGDVIVKMNNAAIDRGAEEYRKIDVPAAWENIEDTAGEEAYPNDFVRDVLHPIALQKGDLLPVSRFTEDGTFPTGMTQFEKRGIAVNLPCWISENCIQCNQCSLVCPHAVIRPYLLTDEEAAQVPEGTPLLNGKGKGVSSYKYKIQISPLDCTGCGSCADVCPAKQKALVMKPFEEIAPQEETQYNYLKTVPVKDNVMDKGSIKGSQFQQPLFEFSGACAGCGETPYVKLVTQLFGSRMVIANATGCSSIYGGTAPVSPYTVDKDGNGPTWANSLFEDNAEYGLGMQLGISQTREKLALLAEEAKSFGIAAELKNALESWLVAKDNADESVALSKTIRSLLPDAVKGSSDGEKAVLTEMLEKQDYFAKKSIWIVGGDGWAYDIGYGGLDHVIASGEDVNILVMDTEVYSNTGGQASKASQTGQVAKFAATGKEQSKKDLGLMAMSYGYVYVACVSLGANMNQVVKAFREAEAYPGPSLLICYSPCINHGINMTHSINEAKRAVQSGYWPLYRYNPALKNQGKNPFVLESKEPDGSFQQFLASEVRYSSLKKMFPDIAEKAFVKAEKDMITRNKYYRKLADIDFSDFAE